jgi:hypothetical protein
MLSIAFVLGLSAFSGHASAHGNVRKWLMNGKEYITYLPYDQPDLTQPPTGIGKNAQVMLLVILAHEKVARFLGNGINPMKDPLSPAMTCNVDSYPAPLMANVTAGSTITATWNSCKLLSLL